jgi:hypothetical protein
MTPRSLLLLTLVLVATATAAAAGPAGAQAPPNPVDPQIADGSAQTALDAAKTRWKAAKIDSYRFQARRACYCPGSGWVTVTVRHGSPSVRRASNVKAIATVPRQFRTIQQAIDGRVHDLAVTYGTYGVPRKISIDRIAYVADEEQYFSTRAFHRR